MATRDEINEEFYAGYGDQPRSMTFMDYLTPSSYIDPYKSLRVAPDQKDERGITQPSNEVARIKNNVPSFSMPNLTDYIPKEIPNVFGVNNPLYAGLLGQPQAEALSKQSNVAGLLSAAAALAQGMGRQGARRSAFQNIIGALGAGYGSAGQAYQQGLQTYGQTQQLALQQRQQAGIQAMKMKYPDLADEFDTNPAGAFRIVAEREAATKKPTVVSEGGTLVSPTGQVLFTAPSKSDKTANVKDYEYYLETLPENVKPLSFKDFQDSVRKSQSVTTNVYTGQLSKTTQGEVEKNVLSSAEAVGRLNSIYGSYKPEYLNIPFRLKQEWSGLASKFKDIPEADKKILVGYSTFKQNALQNLNKTIKDLTGAAMGVQEADRIIASLPNAGTTVFGGDSPQEFEAKLDNAVQQTKYALARQNYALKQGISKDAWEKYELSDMPSIVEKRADEIAKAYKLNKNDPKDRQTIKRQVAAEFGIPF